MQRHSALTSLFPSTCRISHFTPSHSPCECFVLALGALLLPLSTPRTMPQQMFSAMAGKVKVHHVRHLAQLSQLMLLKMLHSHVLLNGHLTLVTQNPQLFSQYPSKLLPTPVHHSTEAGT